MYGGVRVSILSDFSKEKQSYERLTHALFLVYFMLPFRALLHFSLIPRLSQPLYVAPGDSVCNTEKSTEPVGIRLSLHVLYTGHGIARQSKARQGNAR